MSGNKIGMIKLHLLNPIQQQITLGGLREKELFDPDQKIGQLSYMKLI